MLLGFIPIQQSNYFARAQDAAIKARGGDALIDGQGREKWFRAWVLSGCTAIASGAVVRLNK